MHCNCLRKAGDSTVTLECFQPPALLFYTCGCTNLGKETAGSFVAADRQQCNWERALSIGNVSLLLQCPFVLRWNFQSSPKAVIVSQAVLTRRERAGKAPLPPQMVLEGWQKSRGVYQTHALRGPLACSGALGSRSKHLVKLQEGVARDGPQHHSILAQRWCWTVLMGWLPVCSYPS